MSTQIDNARQHGVAQMLQMVREISRQTDPQEMITVFRRYTPSLYGGDGSISLSRRGLTYPAFRVTRSTRWKAELNPWREQHKLPLLRGGLLADLLYRGAAEPLSDVRLSADDPAFEYLGNVRSILPLPLFDDGEALNMVVRFSHEAGGFDQVRVEDALLVANLFGRATSHLLTAQRLQAAYAQLDREMEQVAAIQRSLLPRTLPRVPGLDIAASYRTAARAGGDYYDFFDLGDGRWGLLVADVSGHGTPAAVVMSMLRTMLHAQCKCDVPPGELLASVNERLIEQAHQHNGIFTTAFYGVYDERNRALHYACAGHNPPLLVESSKRVRELDEAQALPLAIDRHVKFDEAHTQLARGDTLLLYTDGITEAAAPHGEMYGRDRLLSCIREEVPSAQHIIDCVTHKLIGFTGGAPQDDDQTLVALRAV